jgi:hypothetical protein
MTDRKQKKTSRRNKLIILMFLFIISGFVVAAGVILSALSILNNISFTVFQSEIPGAVFGLIVVFLGIRYFMSVLKLKPELLKDENRFSWGNFKKKVTSDRLGI